MFTAILKRAVSALGLVAMGSGTVLAQQPIQMDFGSWAPSTHHLAINAFEPWVKLVEEKTNKRVKANLYHGAVLGASRATLNDVKGGTYQVGLMISSYYFDTPLFKLTIGELPFALSNPTAGAKVMREFVNKYANDSFDKLDIKNMGIFVSDPYVLMSTKPIRRIEDMKNKKVRIPGKAWVDIAKGWGAIPLSTQLEDSNTALERGTLDIMQTTPGSAMGFRFYEPAYYITELNAPTIVGGLIMNKTFYDKLPADLRKLFDEDLNPALLRMITSSYEKSTKESFDKIRAHFKASGKGEIIPLAEEERLKFMKTTEGEWSAWVKEANRRGYPGEAMMADFKGIMKKNGLAAPF